MTDPAQKYSQLFQAGRMEEFMRSTRGDVTEIKADVRRLAENQTHLSKAMAEHSTQAASTAQDVGEIKAAMTELHQCVTTLSSKIHHHESSDEINRSSQKGKWKHIGLGALAAVGVLSFVVAVAAGKDGDILATLARVLGVLI